MPLLTNRICGVCPEAHHMAAAKAADAVYKVDPPPTAKKITRALIFGVLLYRSHNAFLRVSRTRFCHGTRRPDCPAQHPGHHP
ncbi:MAG: nickel-dependent hydrogenase large subunit [Anaerolineales bacterium]|nr:nickel-dependent hydrogenase large subunit [Anaerolineales bacterium]